MSIRSQSMFETISRQLARVRVRTQFLALVGALALGFVTFGVRTAFTLSEVKVGGPVYSSIVRGKDLVADILPPPNYIIESYLVTMELLNAQDSAARSRLVARLGKLHDEFSDRWKYWKTQPLSAEIRHDFLDDSMIRGAEFYKVAESEFVPALGTPAAADAFRKLTRIYEAHRSAIDKVVAQASAENARAESDATTKLDHAWLILLLAFAGSMGTGIFLTLLMSRSMSRDIGKICTDMERIAGGDLSRPIHVDRQDEIGEIARRLESVRVQWQGLVTDLKAQGERVTGAIATLSRTTDEVRASAASQSEASAAIAASTEELTTSIASMSDNAETSRGIASEADALSREVQQVVEDTSGAVTQNTDSVDEAVALVQELGKRSESISRIVAMIGEVASQTNMLALNAAIEAARAGEQGRGFSVVADEVRILAERTSESTQEIAGVISAIQDGVNKVSENMQRTSERARGVLTATERASQSTRDIRSSTDRLSAEFAAISDALREQKAASNTVAAEVEQIARMAESTSEAMTAAVAVSRDLGEASSALTQAIGRFRV
ncbi:MAG: HAMP domain-containing protein [Betaproteobacteria bacterium]|nr:HAMP domain-containing protein [Betaproteobacteria bacterium]